MDSDGLPVPTIKGENFSFTVPEIQAQVFVHEIAVA